MFDSSLANAGNQVYLKLSNILNYGIFVNIVKLNHTQILLIILVGI